MDRQPHSKPRWFSGRIPRWNRLAVLLCAISLVVSASGCQIIIGAMMILRGFPKETADFKKFTGKSLADKGRKTIVLATCPDSARSESPSLDVDLITQLSRRLKAHEVNVIDAHKVASWIDDNGGIEEDTELSKIGRQFKADYIVLVNIQNFSIYEENSRHFYRGRADGMVLAVEMQGEGKQKVAKKIYHKPFRISYPSQQPVPADTERREVFMMRYMDRLSQELAQLFHDYRLEDSI